MFEQSFVDRMRPARRKATLLASFLLQSAALLAMVMLPMVFVNDLPAVVLAAAFELSPPPSPPPPVTPIPEAQARIIQEFHQGPLLQPHSIPDQVAMIVEEVPPAYAPASGIGVPVMPGGIGGGLSAAIRNALSAVPRPAPPPAQPAPPEPNQVQRLHVGGKVQPPMLLRKVNPVYPQLARQARISGEVRIEAIIGVDGSVHDVRAVSGHPLLAPAAQEAVRQWVYRPPTLNGEPIEVVIVVTVSFRLG